MHRAPRERTTFQHIFPLKWGTAWKWVGEAFNCKVQTAYTNLLSLLYHVTFLLEQVDGTNHGGPNCHHCHLIHRHTINHLQLFRRESQYSPTSKWCWRMKSQTVWNMCREHTISSSQGSDKSTNLAKVTGVNNVNSPLIVCEDIAILTVDSYRINLHIFKYKDAHSNWAQNAL